LFSHASSARRGISKVALDVRERRRGWERGRTLRQYASATFYARGVKSPRPAIIDRSKIVSRAVPPELPRVDLFDERGRRAQQDEDLYFRLALLRVV